MTEEIVKQDTRLVVSINNKQPIELLDLITSLLSLASQFSSYVKKNGTNKTERETKLFVKEIKSGSVVVELVELATVSLIPFAENMNTIFEFATYCKNALTYILKGNEPENNKLELSPNDYREFSAIVNPIAKDNASQINFSTTINGNPILNFNFDSIQSNAIQNTVKRQLNVLKQPETEGNIYEKVIFTWFQARSDIKSKTGNRGLIESLNEKAMNVIIENEKTKEDMLHSDNNPLKTAFVVDAKIENINGKPAVYRIIKLHDFFDIEE
jgi:hypothetical protein